MIEPDHDVSEDCVCGPTVEPVKRDDGSVGWVVVHHSLDGRELSESPTTVQAEEALRADVQAVLPHVNLEFLPKYAMAAYSRLCDMTRGSR